MGNLTRSYLGRLDNWGISQALAGPVDPELFLSQCIAISVFFEDQAILYLVAPSKNPIVFVFIIVCLIIY